MKNTKKKSQKIASCVTHAKEAHLTDQTDQWSPGTDVPTPGPTRQCLCPPLYIRGDRVTWKVLAEYSWSPTTTPSGSFLYTATSSTPIRVVTREVRYIHELSLTLEYSTSISSPAAPGLTTTKMKVVDLEKLWNFIVDNFLIWIYLATQTSNLHLVLYNMWEKKMEYRHKSECGAMVE